MTEQASIPKLVEELCGMPMMSRARSARARWQVGSMMDAFDFTQPPQRAAGAARRAPARSGRFLATGCAPAARTRMKRVLCLLLVAACGSHGNGNHGDDGMGPDGGSGSSSGSAMCGDGVVDGSEQCDDGNTMSGDGCSATCETESSGGLCSPYSFRCSTNGDVETCNNAGTAWLEVEHCATGCAAGVCTDATCTPGATRCHGNAVETCNAGGTGWDATAQCSTYCAVGQCALPTTQVSTNSNYHGTVIVAGDFSVGNNSTLTADTGDLTIVADNITIAAGAAIAVAPTGNNSQGQGCYYSYYGYTEPANYGQPPTSYMVSRSAARPTPTSSKVARARAATTTHACGRPIR